MGQKSIRSGARNSGALCTRHWALHAYFVACSTFPSSRRTVFCTGDSFENWSGSSESAPGCRPSSASPPNQAPIQSRPRLGSTLCNQGACSSAADRVLGLAPADSSSARREWYWKSVWNWINAVEMRPGGGCFSYRCYWQRRLTSSPYMVSYFWRVCSSSVAQRPYRAPPPSRCCFHTSAGSRYSNENTVDSALASAFIYFAEGRSRRPRRPHWLQLHRRGCWHCNSYHPVFCVKFPRWTQRTSPPCPLSTS